MTESQWYQEIPYDTGEQEWTVRPGSPIPQAVAPAAAESNEKPVAEQEPIEELHTADAGALLNAVNYI